jgi:hypothetical protein
MRAITKAGRQQGVALRTGMSGSGRLSVCSFTALHKAKTWAFSAAKGFLSPQALVDALTVLAALATTHLAVWLALGSLRFALGGAVHAIDPILALPIAAALCAFLVRKQSSMPSSIARALLAFVLVWAAALLYANCLDDLTEDGQGYHSLATLALRLGWNPFYAVLAPDVHPQIWLNHYPKAPWIWAADIDTLFGNLQTGKAINVVLAVAAGAAVAGAASTIFAAPVWMRLIFGALAAANPVASVQFPTLYVDGQLASLLTLMLAGAITWLLQRSALGLLMTCSAAICLVNVKFTGLAYAAIFAAVIAALGLVRGQRLLSGLPLLASAFALVGPGYTPYITNLRNGEHIFYPVLGAQRFDIMTRMTPKALAEHSQIAKLGISLASETANSCQNCQAGRLKLPFTVRLAEAWGATIPDPRTGGFGPLFSAALLLSAVLLIQAGRTGAVSAMLVGSLIVLIGSVLINPEAWWARYAPQLWLVPLTVLMFLQMSELSPAARAVRVALLVVLIANAAFMAIIASGYAAVSTHKARAQIAALAHAGPLYVQDVQAFGWFGTLQRLRDGGVVFEERAFSDSDCKVTSTVLRSELEVCVPKTARAATTPRQEQ